jgi:hypothetical protein
MVVKEQKRKTKAADPLTMDEIQERKTRERITAYRALVTRAAAGEQLSDDDLTTASDLLDGLGLPPFAWARDVAGQKAYAAATAEDAGLTAAEPVNADRLKAIDARLKAMDAELKTLREEQHDLAHVQVMRRVAIDRRLNELLVNHPHVFDDLEQAVALRLKAKNTPPPTPPQEPPQAADPLVGWSR